jgi:hypothetical protein
MFSIYKIFFIFTLKENSIAKSINISEANIRIEYTLYPKYPKSYKTIDKAYKFLFFHHTNIFYVL